MQALRLFIFIFAAAKSAYAYPQVQSTETDTSQPSGRKIGPLGSNPDVNEARNVIRTYRLTSFCTAIYQVQYGSVIPGNLTAAASPTTTVTTTIPPAVTVPVTATMTGTSVYLTTVTITPTPPPRRRLNARDLYGVIASQLKSDIQSEISRAINARLSGILPYLPTQSVTTTSTPDFSSAEPLGTGSPQKDEEGKEDKEGKEDQEGKEDKNNNGESGNGQLDYELEDEFDSEDIKKRQSDEDRLETQQEQHPNESNKFDTNISYNNNDGKQQFLYTINGVRVPRPLYPYQSNSIVYACRQIIYEEPRLNITTEVPQPTGIFGAGNLTTITTDGAVLVLPPSFVTSIITGTQNGTAIVTQTDTRASTVTTTETVATTTVPSVATATVTSPTTVTITPGADTATLLATDATAAST